MVSVLEESGQPVNPKLRDLALNSRGGPNNRNRWQNRNKDNSSPNSNGSMKRNVWNSNKGAVDQRQSNMRHNNTYINTNRNNGEMYQRSMRNTSAPPMSYQNGYQNTMSTQGYPQQNAYGPPAARTYGK